MGMDLVVGRFARAFSHAPRVVATVGVPSSWDKQAVLAHTVRAVYPHGSKP